MTIGGGSLGMLPSGRGTPGALGFCDGSNTSERRPVAGGGGGAGGEGWAGTGAGCSGGRAPGGGGWTGGNAGAHAAGGANLIFELLVAVLQLLDGAGHLPDLRFEALDAQHLLGGRPLGLLLAGGLRRLLPKHAADRRQRRIALLGGGGARNAKGGHQGRCRKPTEHQRDHWKGGHLSAAV